MKYIIKDWAGNVCFDGKQFDDADDAFSYIESHIPNASEMDDEQLSTELNEYIVEEVE